MAGLVNDATGVVSTPSMDPATTTQANATNAIATGYNASQSQAAQMQPTTGTASTAGLTTNSVNTDQTVAGQLKGIIDDNSPLLQQARTQALANANSRGLLNSSMAETGAQSAVLSAALPIAQQDASANFSNAEHNMDASNTNAQFNAGQTQDITKTNLGYTNNASQVNTANQQQTNLTNQQATNQAGQFTAAAQNAASSQNAQQQTQTSQFNANQANQTSQFNAQQSNTAALQAMDETVKTYMDQQDNATKVQLQAMDGNTKVQLANIQAQYQELMQSSQSASDIYKTIVGNVTTIMTDKDMDPAAKQAAVNQQVQMLQSGMAVAGQVANVNLGSLLNFSAGSIAQQANPAPTPVAPAQIFPPDYFDRGSNH
jgi:hypothetical protein